MKGAAGVAQGSTCLACAGPWVPSLLTKRIPPELDEGVDEAEMRQGWVSKPSLSFEWFLSTCMAPVHSMQDLLQLFWAVQLAGDIFPTKLLSLPHLHLEFAPFGSHLYSSTKS